MKKICKGAALGALFLCLTACVSGPVENKRVDGPTDDRTYQIRIGDANILAPEEFWLTVSREAWNRCQMEEQYPECQG